MRKKLLTVLATAALASTLAGGLCISASAGVVENKPAGNGLLTATNELNIENFKIVGEEGDTSAYTMASSDNVNHILDYGAGEWQEMLVNKGVPKETMAKGATVSLRYNFWGTGWTATDGIQMKLVPGASSITESHTYGYVLVGGNAGFARVAGERTEAKETDPVSQINGADFTADVGWVNLGFYPGNWVNYNDWGFPVQTYQIDMTVNTNNWVDVTLKYGVPQNGGYTWVQNCTVTNWAPYDGTHDFYANTWIRYAENWKLEDVNLSATYTEGEETKTDVIFASNMSKATVVTEEGAEAKADCFIARGVAHVPTEPTGLIVTNPVEGSGIMARGALAVDETLATNFELNTKYILTNLGAGQKVGIAFGFENNRAIDGAHKFIYFTNVDGAISIGAEIVDEEGNVTQAITPVAVAGANNTDAIALNLTGKLANLEIQVGTNEAIVLENFNIDGFFAFTHKGEGVSYIFAENATMTGYEFLGNAENATAISTNFNGSYINTSKFQQQSTVTPETFMTKADTTTHDLVGMVAEEGKLGFYGSSTGTRLLTAEKYADFVMQFDYTSVPFLERGQLTGIDRQSQFYIVFGMKEGGKAFTDADVYAIGIYEGVSTFYGDNLSVVSTLGMATTCGGQTAGLSKYVATTEPDANSIPRYAVGGYDPTKPNNNVEAWFNAVEGGTYNFYNKTTRVKLVAVNNQVALYVAEVNTETGAIIGEYVKINQFTAKDTEGYLGIATDAPGWAEVDNLAITPVSRETALTITALDQITANGIVADIAPADMDEDPAPTPLAKPVLVADNANKKVTWTAVDGAKEYVVSVKLGTEFVIEEKTITATEIDLSTITAAGTYKVIVEAIPEDAETKLSSRADIGYTVEEAGPEVPETSVPSTSVPEGGEQESSGGCGSSIAFAGIAGVLAIAGAVSFLRKKED